MRTWQIWFQAIVSFLAGVGGYYFYTIPVIYNLVNPTVSNGINSMLNYIHVTDSQATTILQGQNVVGALITVIVLILFTLAAKPNKAANPAVAT